jgi:predicted outer membrane repeat protein
MKTPVKAIILIIWVLATSASAVERYVPTPEYPNIQSAINAAEAGDSVIIAPGRYSGGGNGNIELANKTITVRSIEPNDPNIVAETVIDGQNSATIFYIQGQYLKENNSTIAGLTLTNCSYDRYHNGGAIFCYISCPTIRGCVITGNRAKRGGAIYCRISSPVIINCTMSNNTATEEGGAIYCAGRFYCGCGPDVSEYDCACEGPKIINCVIKDNSASRGGAICNGYTFPFGGKLLIANCTITGNYASEGGGGIRYSVGYYLTVTDSIIAGNTAEYFGGGIYSSTSSPSKLTVTNCTLSGNFALCGGGIYSGSTGFVIANSVLWDNKDYDRHGTVQSAQIYYNLDYTPNVVFSCIQDDDPNDLDIPFGEAANNNIDDNPMFVREPNDGGDGWGQGGNDDFGDLHLRRGSPCIDSGCCASLPYGSERTDIDGQARIMNGRIEMGADEFYAPLIVVKRPAGGEVWTGGSSQWIEWEAYGAGNLDILLSQDGGSSRQTVQSNIANTGSYFWHLPDKVNSDECIISIIPSVPDGNISSEASGIFEIHPYPKRPDAPPGLKPPNRLPWRLERQWSGPEVGCVKWQFVTGGPVTAAAAAGFDNKVYVACQDGKLYALNGDNGTLLWSYDTGTPLIAAAAAGYNGMVFAGGEDGRLYAVDDGGNLKWTHSTNGFIYSSPVVSPEGKVYVCSEDGVFYTLGANGSELWSLNTGVIGGMDGSILATPVIAKDSTIYLGSLYDPNLYALNPQNGAKKWNCNFKSRGWPFTSPAIGADGTIYQTLVYDSNLYAIEPNGGTVVWSTNLAVLSDPCSEWYDPNYKAVYNRANCLSRPAVGPDGTIYVSFDDPYLRAVKADGTIKWLTKLGATGGFTLTAGSNGLVYAASDDGFLYVVNSNGEEVSMFEGKGRLSYPLITSEGTIIVSDSNNTVWAIARCNSQGQGTALRRPEYGLIRKR